MAFDILFWVGWIAFAAVLIMFVYVILSFAWPIRSSEACRKMLKAKRENKPIVALDDGSRWVWKVGEHFKGGVILDDDKLPIEVTPQSLKYGGGVLFGAGEFFRSKIANSKVVDLLSQAEKKKMSPEAVARHFKNIEELVNNEIDDMAEKRGLKTVDGFKGDGYVQEEKADNEPEEPDTASDSS